MRLFLFICLFSSSLYAWAQVNPLYDQLQSLCSDDRALFEKFHSYKKQEGLIKGILGEIAEIRNDSLEQHVMLTFYDHVYGYKWVSDEDLQDLIKSVIRNAQSDHIRKLAIQLKTDHEQGLKGKVLPPIRLANASGEFIDLATIESPYIVIDLWATWCGPCIQEMKKIPALKEKYKSIEFYSISFDEKINSMIKFVKKKKYDWPIVFAGKGHELWDYFDVRAIPHYFIVDADRKILTSTVFELEEELEKLAY